MFILINVYCKFSFHHHFSKRRIETAISFSIKGTLPSVWYKFKTHKLKKKTELKIDFYKAFEGAELVWQKIHYSPFSVFNYFKPLLKNEFYFLFSKLSEKNTILLIKFQIQGGPIDLPPSPLPTTMQLLYYVFHSFMGLLLLLLLRIFVDKNKQN